MRNISLFGGVVMMVVLMISVAIFFDGRGTVNAQGIEYTPDEVARMEFMVNTGDTCWDLATHYVGSGQRCPELVAVNPDQLTYAGHEDPGLEAGMILNVPRSWFMGFLGPDIRHGAYITPFVQTLENQASLASDQDKGPASLITGLVLGALAVFVLGVLIYVTRTRLLPWIRGAELFKWPPGFLSAKITTHEKA